ncbi:uncharacterized protein DUF445 [Orenia metallireducens]|jgi:uncharacterized membrane protein YheB (UPF0754 family)|uniref:DUF445 domain-containing protein n=1 Tax=Orenia metallireducens TaxID=1413210 RepID=A0A285GUC3_9FIRM|nr:DUF445 family protein [Orenia metallireducens]PRX25268.1 uncharacterized protein DUF445 [Orenia metallireducens]SNY27058.1 Protein of unknown function [Orenia metallireducens]
MAWKLTFLPIIGALIGWITNYLAIKLLFKPYEPVKIPLLNFQLQGILPKRREELAKKVGEIVEKDLLPKEELERELAGLEVKDDIKEAIVRIIDEKAEKKIPPFIPDNFKVMIINFLKEMVNKDLDPYLDQLMDKFKDKVVNEVDIAKLVEAEIGNFEMKELEELALEVASKELKHIEVLGAILGFIVGIGQALIVANF